VAPPQRLPFTSFSHSNFVAKKLASDAFLREKNIPTVFMLLSQA
jgi:hypothetical protein